MKITETITSNTITILLSALSGLFGILLGSIYSEVFPIILPTLTQKLPITVLLRILLVVLILLVLSIVLTIFVYLKYKPMLRPHFGVLWDKNKEAYCSVCKTLLSQYKAQQRESGGLTYFFLCPKCQMLRYLQDGAIPISLEEAKKNL